MELSPQLSDLNVARYRAWKPEFTARNARPAMFAFDGDVYGGLDARSLQSADIRWAQSHLCILSGLHGVLRPLEIGGTTLPAGAYTLYMIPSETGASQLAFSTDVGKWGIPVDQSHDLARFDLTKESLGEPVDQLTLAIDNDQAHNRGVLRIMWENTQFSLPFTVAK